MNTSLHPDLIPSYEHERLEALQPYQVLGTPGQGAFNDFVSVVARLLDVPIALISLVREDDVVFVGNAGLPQARVVGRADSMCSVAILKEGLTVYEDILAEPCTLVNPAIARQMNLGFYAGIALRAPSGMALGSLCILDRQPRTISAAESKLLTRLALVAEELLALQATYASETDEDSELRIRLDNLLQESFARLVALASLRGWYATTFPGETDRYTDSRLEAASTVAASLHRELQAALRAVGSSWPS